MRTRVLIMEDNPGLAERMAMFLSEAGYHCRTVGGVGKALREIGQFAPHLVIADFHVTDGTALDLLAGLRACGAASVPVLLATAAGSAAHRVAAENGQVRGVLDKPVALDQLPALVERFADLSIRPVGRSRLIGPEERQRLLHASFADEGAEGLGAPTGSLL